MFGHMRGMTWVSSKGRTGSLTIFQSLQHAGKEPLRLLGDELQVLPLRILAAAGGRLLLRQAEDVTPFLVAEGHVNVPGTSGQLSTSGTAMAGVPTFSQGLAMKDGRTLCFIPMLLATSLNSTALSAMR